MTNIWLTSDTHYSHSNIIKYCNRPFDDAKHMDQALLENYNSVVKPNDIVYHLGDFGFNTETARYLQGRKHLIIGNHDWKLVDKLKPHFQWCRDTFLLRDGGLSIWLAHYPHRAWPRAFHGSYHFFGHVHNAPDHKKCPPHGRSCDVGVDAWGYKPVHLDTLIAFLKDQPTEGEMDL